MKTSIDTRILVYVFAALFLSAVFGSCRNAGSETFGRLKREYASARKAQRMGDFSTAEDGFRRCIDMCLSSPDDADDSVRNMLPQSMVQLMNVFQSEGKPDASVAYFDSLKTIADASRLSASASRGGKTGDMLAKYFRRDVYVLLAYSMSRTDKETEAARLMDVALGMPLYNPTHERLFRDYAYAAVVYFCVPTCQDKVYKYGLMALDETKLCEHKSGAQWLVTMLGSMYHRCGKVDKAISMYEEGYEIAAMDRDTLGMANAKKEIADYLLQWQIDSLADRYASEAVDYLEDVENTNPMVEATVYVVRAKTLIANGYSREARAFLEKARSACKGLPYNSGPSDVDVQMGSMMVSGKNAKEYAEGMAMLQRAASGATYKLRTEAWFELGRAYIEHGDRQRGEAALDSMYRAAHLTNVPMDMGNAYAYALAHYERVGDEAHTRLYSDACREVEGIMNNPATIKSIVDVLTKQELERKERESQRQASASMQTYALWIGAVVVLLIAGGVWFVGYRNAYRRRHSLAVRRLSSAREELSTVREELSSAQADLRKVAQEKEMMNRRLTQIESRNADNVRDGVSLLDILRSKGDDKFKEYFCRAYPYFLKTLREESEHVTNKEELYCMLIALGQTNAELAQAFSVERSSVTIAKYRLRKKINLAEGETLEEKLEEMLQNHNK